MYNVQKIQMCDIANEQNPSKTNLRLLQMKKCVFMKMLSFLWKTQTNHRFSQTSHNKMMNMRSCSTYWFGLRSHMRLVLSKQIDWISIAYTNTQNPIGETGSLSEMTSSYFGELKLCLRSCILAYQKPEYSYIKSILNRLSRKKAIINDTRGLHYLTCNCWSLQSAASTHHSE